MVSGRNLSPLPAGSDCHTKHLLDTDRIRIRTLFFDGRIDKQEIANRTGFSIGQVKNAIRAPSASARPRSGRPGALSHEQEQQLVEYVTSSQQASIRSGALSAG
ncbi:hypothetical protein LZ30DRAFT_228763 [Colletotrichum cereale]|nr:hypothetical protein LZ30DRAFT_228763 [Colletotrichum cereale]